MKTTVFSLVKMVIGVKLQILKTEFWMMQMALLQLLLLQKQIKKVVIEGLGFAVLPADKKLAATVANNSITL